MNILYLTNELLLGGSDRSITVWDVQTFEVKATLTGNFYKKIP